MLLHKKCTFLGLVLMLLGIIVARFVIVSPNAVFDCILKSFSRNINQTICYPSRFFLCNMGQPTGCLIFFYYNTFLFMTTGLNSSASLS